MPALAEAAPTASPAPAAPPLLPTLVVIGEATPASAEPVPDARWAAVLPQARRVLAVGADAAALATAHLSRFPQAQWWAARLPGEDTTALPPGVQACTDALDEAQGPLGVDLLVLGSAFATLPQGADWLRAASRRCTRGAVLVTALDNAASATRIQHLIEGDDTPQDPAAAGPACSPPALFKRLMDAGWMPHAADHAPCDPRHDAAARALRGHAQALGVGAGHIDLLHRMERLIVMADSDMAQAPAEQGPARFTVVVPTNHERQLRANVECSPGLREVQARIVSVRRVPSPAAALAAALPHCQADWVLLCHQDVYFPAGFGERLNAVLAGIAPQDHARTLIGFVGMGVDRATSQPVNAGHVIDRLNRMSAGESDTALSIDELAVVMSRDTLHRIDETIGWHLWATDLCLTSIKQHKVFPKIVRLPIFHNSRTGWTLPDDFYDAAARLMAKHTDFKPIHTLCGVLDDRFLAQRPGKG